MKSGVQTELILSTRSFKQSTSTFEQGNNESALF